MDSPEVLVSIILFGVIAVIVLLVVSDHIEVAKRKPYKSQRAEKERNNNYQVPQIIRQTAKVNHVIDGDTVVVSTSWHTLKIRLDSIDCAETDQYWGDIARYGLIKLIGGRWIDFEEHYLDKYGRTVATIYVQHNSTGEWINVNARMVTLGHAWVMRHHYQHLPKDRQDELNRLERWARTKRVGLWNSPNPIPPWRWRTSNNWE